MTNRGSLSSHSISPSASSSKKRSVTTVALLAGVFLCSMYIFGTSYSATLDIHLDKTVYSPEDRIRLQIKGPPKTIFSLFITNQFLTTVYPLTQQHWILDETGRYEFEIGPLQPGEYTVTVQTKRFVQHAPFEVREGISSPSSSSPQQYSPNTTQNEQIHYYRTNSTTQNSSSSPAPQENNNNPGPTPSFSSSSTESDILAQNEERVCSGPTCQHIFYSYPKYRQAENGWVEINESIQRHGCNNKRAFCVQGMSFNATFTRQFNGSVVNLSYLGSFISFGNFSFGRRAMQRSLAVLQDNKIIYPDIWPGVNVSYVNNFWGLKEEISFANASVLNGIANRFNFTFPIDFSGSYKRGPRGKLRFSNGSRQLFELEPITIFDANNSLIDIVNISIRSGRAFFQLNRSRLIRRDVAYPIVIDPSIVLNGSDILWDGHICYKASEGSYAREDIAQLYVGRTELSSGCLFDVLSYRSGIDWNITSIPDTATITDINLTLFVDTLGDGGDFSINHMEGNSSLYVDDSGDNQYFYEDMGNGTYNLTTIDTGSVFYDFNLSAGLSDLQNRLPENSFSIGINSSNEDDGSAETRFAASTYGTAARRPRLTVTYSLTPPTPVLNAPGDGAHIQLGNDIVFNVSATDPDAGESFFFEIYAAKTPSFDLEDLVYKETAVANATDVFYNITTLPFKGDGTTILLLHFDNRSEFNENNSYMRDFSINQTNGSCLNCPSFNETGGKLGGAFEFGGTGSEDEIVLPSVSTTVNYTIITWVYPQRTSETFSPIIVEDINEGLFYKNDSQVVDLIYSGAPHASTTALEYDTWTHVAVTVNASGGIDIYINGRKDAVHQGGGAMQLVSIGNDELNEDFGGRIDELIVYNRTLTAQQVERSYNLSKGLYYWHINVSDPFYESQSATRSFWLNRQPSISLHNPTNDKHHYVSEVNLSASGAENDPEDSINISYYVSLDPNPQFDDLAYQVIDANNNTIYSFNFTVPILQNDSDVQLLLHFDNRFELGENNSHVYDFSGLHNGSVQGDPIFNRTDGKVAGSYVGDGSGDRINITGCYHDCYKMRNATYMGWVKTTSESGANPIMGSLGVVSQLGFAIYQSGTNFEVRGDSFSGPVDDDFFTGEAGNWVHFIVTKVFNGSGVNVTIYKNTQEVANGHMMAIFDGTGLINFWVGENDGLQSNTYWNGSLDEIAIINRTLTHEERVNVYEIQKDRYYWYANVTDGIETIQSTIESFVMKNTIPNVTIHAPSNHTNSSTGPELSITPHDDDNDELLVRIFGSNQTPTPEDIIFQKTTVSPDTVINFTWNHTLQKVEPNTFFLLHLDNNSVYKENNTAVTNFLNGNTYAVTGNAQPNMSGGKLGGSFDFFGTDGYITADSASPLTDFTVVGWIKPFSVTDEDRGIIGDFTFDEEGFQISQNLDRINVTVSTDSETAVSGFFEKYKWVHIAVILDDTSNQVLIYKNGILNTTGSMTANTGGIVPIRIGNNVDSSLFGAFNGSLDDIAIYSTVLSADEIADLYRLKDGQYYWKVNVSDALDSAENETYLFTIDSIAPLDLQIVSPTLDNNSNISLDWYFVNVTFTETNPSHCTLQQSCVHNFTGTCSSPLVVNYTMTRSGTNCWINRTEEVNARFNYVVFVSDATNNTNLSVTRVINLDQRSPRIDSTMVNTSTIEMTLEFHINVSADDDGVGLSNVTVSNTTVVSMINESGIWKLNTTPIALGCSALFDDCNLTIRATDYAGNTNTTSVTLTIIKYLNTTLLAPVNNKNLPQNITFLVNATVICIADTCGDVAGTLRYNTSSAVPDTNISNVSGTTPFHIVDGPNPLDCPGNPLTANEYCNLTWTVNTTGAPGDQRSIGVFFNSTQQGVMGNFTNNNTVNIIECTIDFSLQFPNVTFGIGNVGELINATSNDGPRYNITIGVDTTCPLDLYIRGSQLVHETVPSYVIASNNISFHNQTNNPALGQNINDSFTLINRSVPTTVNTSLFFWLNIPLGILNGFYNSTLTFTAVKEGNAP